MPDYRSAQVRGLWTKGLKRNLFVNGKKGISRKIL
jgi:hypothetical protein